MEMQSDFDRLLFFEHTRKTAEATYAENPFDAENLLRWGGAMIELAQFQNPQECRKMLEDAKSKLDEALVIDPKKHEAMYYIGNANTSYGFMTPDEEEAKVYFDQAIVYFQKAVDEDPTNDLYHKSLEVAAKGPELHAEVRRQQGLAQQTTGSGSSTATTAKSSKAKKNNTDLKYDIFGWVILAVGIVAWVGFAKSQAPPPPHP